MTCLRPRCGYLTRLKIRRPHPRTRTMHCGMRQELNGRIRYHTESMTYFRMTHNDLNSSKLFYMNHLYHYITFLDI